MITNLLGPWLPTEPRRMPLLSSGHTLRRGCAKKDYLLFLISKLQSISPTRTSTARRVADAGCIAVAETVPAFELLAEIQQAERARPGATPPGLRTDVGNEQGVCDRQLRGDNAAQLNWIP